MREVPLYGKKAAGRVALVDDEDYELVMQHRWHVIERSATERRSHYGPYAQTHIYRQGGRTTIRMHVLLTGWRETDHADRDGLNNQRSNLRDATDGKRNRWNSGKHQDGTSGYKGVAWHRRDQRWQARISFEGRRHQIGYFGDAAAAARAYDAKARELYGEYAVLNFPD
jgi:hypothetical protein